MEATERWMEVTGDMYLNCNKIHNKIQHFTRMHNSVAFSTLTVVYNHHHHPVPEHFHHRKRNPLGSFMEKGYFWHKMISACLGWLGWGGGDTAVWIKASKEATAGVDMRKWWPVKGQRCLEGGKRSHFEEFKGRTAGCFESMMWAVTPGS